MASVITNETFDRVTLAQDYNKVEGHFCQELKQKAVPDGDYKLPVWKRLPLQTKIPMKNGPHKGVTLQCADDVDKIYKEFNVNFAVDIAKAQPSLSYSSLRDPYLKRFFETPRMKNHLKRAGLITDDGELRTSLREYNEYRDYVRWMCLRGVIQAKDSDTSSQRSSSSDERRCKSAPVSGFDQKYEKVRGRVQALDARRRQSIRDMEEEYKRRGEWYEEMKKEKQAWQENLKWKQEQRRSSAYQRSALNSGRGEEMMEKWRQGEERRLEKRLMKHVEEITTKVIKTEKNWESKLEFQKKHYELEDQKRRELEELRKAKIEARMNNMHRNWQKLNHGVYRRQNAWRRKRNKADMEFAIRLSEKIAAINGYDLTCEVTFQETAEEISARARSRFKSLWVLEDVLRRLNVPDFEGEKMMRFLKYIIQQSQNIANDTGINEAVDDIVQLALKHIAMAIPPSTGTEPGQGAVTPEVELLEASSSLLDKIVEHLKQTITSTATALPFSSLDDEALDREAYLIALKTIKELSRLFTGDDSGSKIQADRYMSAYDLLREDQNVEKSLSRLFDDVTSCSLTTQELGEITEYTLDNIRRSAAAEEGAGKVEVGLQVPDDAKDAVSYKSDLSECEVANIKAPERAFRRASVKSNTLDVARGCQSDTSERWSEERRKSITPQPDEEQRSVRFDSGLTVTERDKMFGERSFYMPTTFPVTMSNTTINIILEDFQYAQSLGDIARFRRDEVIQDRAISEYSDNKSMTIDGLSDRSCTISDSDLTKSSVSEKTADSIIDGVLKRVKSDIERGRLQDIELTKYVVSLIKRKDSTISVRASLDNFVEKTLQQIKTDLENAVLNKYELQQLISSVSGDTLIADEDNVAYSKLVEKILGDIAKNPDTAMVIASEISKSYHSLYSMKSQKNHQVVSELTSAILHKVLEEVETGHVSDIHLKQLLRSTGSMEFDNYGDARNKVACKIKTVLHGVDSGMLTTTNIDTISHNIKVDVMSTSHEELNEEETVEASSRILESCLKAKLSGDLSSDNLSDIVQYLREIIGEISSNVISDKTLSYIIDVTIEALQEVMLSVRHLDLRNESAILPENYNREVLELAMKEMSVADDLKCAGATVGALLKCVSSRIDDDRRQIGPTDRVLYEKFLLTAIDTITRYKDVKERSPSVCSEIRRDDNISIASTLSMHKPIQVEHLVTIVNAIDSAKQPDEDLKSCDSRDVLAILKYTLEEIIDVLDAQNKDAIDYGTLEKMAMDAYRKKSPCSSTFSANETRRTEDAKHILNLISQSYSSMGDTSLDELLGKTDTDDIEAILETVIKKLLDDVNHLKMPVEEVDALNNAIYSWWFKNAISKDPSGVSTTSTASIVVSDMLRKIHRYISGLGLESGRLCKNKIDEIAAMIYGNVARFQNCTEQEIKDLTEETLMNVINEIQDGNLVANKDVADDIVFKVLNMLVSSDVDESISRIYREVAVSVKGSFGSESSKHNKDISSERTKDLSIKEVRESITEIVCDAMIKTSKDETNENVIEIVEKAVDAIETLVDDADGASETTITRLSTTDYSSLATSAAILKSIMLKFISKASENIPVDTINDLASICAAEITHFCFDSGLLKPQPVHSKCPMIPSSIYRFGDNHKCQYKSPDRLVKTINTIIGVRDSSMSHKTEHMHKIQESNEAGTPRLKMSSPDVTKSDQGPPGIYGTLPTAFSTKSFSDVSGLHDYHLELPPMNPLITPTQRIADIIRATLSKVVGGLNTEQLTDAVVNNMAAVIISANHFEVVSDERINSWLEHGQPFANELKVIENIATDTISQLIGKVNSGQLSKQHMEEIAMARHDSEVSDPVAMRDDLKGVVCNELENIAYDLKHKGILELQCQSLMQSILDKPDQASLVYNEISTLKRLLSDVLIKIGDLLAREDKNDNHTSRSICGSEVGMLSDMCVPDRAATMEKEIGRFESGQTKHVSKANLQNYLVTYCQKPVTNNIDEPHSLNKVVMETEKRANIIGKEKKVTVMGATPVASSTGYRGQSSNIINQNDKNLSNSNELRRRLTLLTENASNSPKTIPTCAKRLKRNDLGDSNRSGRAPPVSFSMRSLADYSRLKFESVKFDIKSASPYLKTPKIYIPVGNELRQKGVDQTVSKFTDYGKNVEPSDTSIMNETLGKRLSEQPISKNKLASQRTTDNTHYIGVRKQSVVGKRIVPIKNKGLGNAIITCNSVNRDLASTGQKLNYKPLCGVKMAKGRPRPSAIGILPAAPGYNKPAHHSIAYDKFVHRLESTKRVVQRDFDMMSECSSFCSGEEVKLFSLDNEKLQTMVNNTHDNADITDLILDKISVGRNYSPDPKLARLNKNGRSDDGIPQKQSPTPTVCNGRLPVIAKSTGSVSLSMKNVLSLKVATEKVENTGLNFSKKLKNAGYRETAISTVIYDTLLYIISENQHNYVKMSHATESDNYKTICAQDLLCIQ